eukprot:CAMPEP_0174868362 /NCGR_PEP_ID=MMETSP1114-20130205/65855_1 /TAXON_ID=312471 /ORGANISM="Neobodo designis, Strain CCAP 1951/1" /LENGTH=40 /DNA_ID= /DNA_START= /DNA_END= /DNA_ORIENTATION=
MARSAAGESNKLASVESTETGDATEPNVGSGVRADRSALV